MVKLKKVDKYLITNFENNKTYKVNRYHLMNVENLNFVSYMNSKY